MLHPRQFNVGEAWIAFTLNDEPIHTEQDGDFRFFALMDAGSCFLLGFASVAVSQGEPSQLESKRLLKEGQAHNKGWPKTLFISKEQPEHFLASEAERVGIEVVRVGEAELLPLIGKAREGFKERFSSRGA